MKNKGEKVEIGSGFRDDDGRTFEPELQPVRRTMISEADASAGGGPENGARVGTLPLAITSEMPAFEAAEMLAKTCHRCAYWRPDVWPEVRRTMESTPEGRASLNQVRAAMLGLGAAVIPEMDNNDDPSDVEHALGAAGVCEALSSIFGDYMVTMPGATCPESGPGGEPLTDLFRPRAGGEARREAARVRDEILFTARRK